jgi:hypothetical protein
MELAHFRRSVGEVTFFSLSARSRFRAIAFGFSELSVAVIPAQQAVRELGGGVLVARVKLAASVMPGRG